MTDFTSSNWTLQNIQLETRSITGRPDTSMMSDAQLTNIINFYYQNVLPKELKIFWGYTYYQFFTAENIDQYEAPTNFQTFNPQVYCDGFQVEWLTDPDSFFSDWPEQSNKVVVGTGDGTNAAFTFAIPAFPVLPRSVYVTDGTQILQDVPTGTTGVGTFINFATGAAVTGSINYSSGAVTNLTFPAAPVNNTNITCTSQTFFASRPTEMLFYKTKPLTDATQSVRDNVNMFVLRPVPDDVYLIKLEGIQVPPALTNSDDVPFRPDLGPLIALGASLHIFKLFNQMDQYDQYLPEYQRFKDISMQDTYEEYLYNRSVPKF